MLSRTQKKLLRELENRDPKRREASLAEVRRLPFEQHLALKIAADGELPHWFWKPIALIVGVSAIAAAVSMAGYSGTILYFGLLAALAVIVCLWPSRSCSAGADLDRVLHECGDENVLGSVLDVVVRRRSEGLDCLMLVPFAKLGLKQATISSLNALTPAQKQALSLILSRPFDDPHLTKAVLNALEQVGDAQAIPVVKRLSEAGALTPLAMQIRDAARECLQYLEIRAEQAQQAQTLLRPSDIDRGSDPNVLLRPAENANQTPPEQLLHSSLPD